MNKNACLTLCFIFGFLLSLDAQVVIKGKIINEQNQPIAFANIGILNKDVGTTSLDNGDFRIIIPKKYLKEALTFASLGYERKSIVIETLKAESTVEIKLKEKPIYLDEIKISSKKIKLKKKLIGTNPGSNAKININSSDQKGGAALAILINPKPKRYNVKGVRINIADNSYSDSKLRIRIFDLDEKEGIPGKDLFHENIIVECDLEKGWLSVDLEKYKISLKEDQFFLAVELIEDLKIRELQDIEDSARIFHYKKLYNRGAKGIEQRTKEVNGKQEIVGYLARNKGVKTLNRSLKEAGVKPSPRTNFKVNIKDASKFPCYSRTASFGKWKIEPFSLVGKVLIEYEK